MYSQDYYNEYTTTQQPQQPVKPKPPVPRDNLVLFVGTSGQTHLEGLKGRFENTRVSQLSIVHEKMSKKEMQGRIYNFKQEIQQNPQITQVTFIYSGHGLRSGLSLGEQIFIYQELLNHILYFDKSKNWNIKEIRIVLDCCYAANLSGHLHVFLSKYQLIDTITQIRLISASDQEGKTVGFGDKEKIQYSPFFEYFFEQAEDFNKSYKVDYIGKGVHIFHYGDVKKGIYYYKSIARCEIFNKINKGVWVIDDDYSE